MIDDLTAADAILDAVSEHSGFTVERLLGPSRERPLVHWRHIAMYLCYVRTDLSYPGVARLFDGRHHTTVMHAVAKIDKAMFADPGLRKRVLAITADLPPIGRD